MADDQVHDPLNFMRSMWGNMGFSLPGMVAPTFDVDELDKRIKDMKAVEGWLRMNLSMLQMTIQGLEMQRTTVGAVQAMGKMASDAAKSLAPDAPQQPPPAPLLPGRRRPCAQHAFRCRHVALANDAADARTNAATCRSSGAGRDSRHRRSGCRQAEIVAQQEIGSNPGQAGTKRRPLRSGSQRDNQAAQPGRVNIDPSVVAEISQATLRPSPPMRMARM